MNNIIITIIYIIIAVYVYGLCFSYYQNYYPPTAKEDYWQDMKITMFLGIVWPFSLLSRFVCFRPSLKDLFIRKPKFW